MTFYIEYSGIEATKAVLKVIPNRRGGDVRPRKVFTSKVLIIFTRYLYCIFSYFIVLDRAEDKARAPESDHICRAQHRSMPQGCS
jgi:hypothetical protein